MLEFDKTVNDYITPLRGVIDDIQGNDMVICPLE
jgi:hypothetical protein